MGFIPCTRAIYFSERTPTVDGHTNLNPWKTIICWHLRGELSFRGFLGGTGFRPPSQNLVVCCFSTSCIARRWARSSVSKERWVFEGVGACHVAQRLERATEKVSHAPWTEVAMGHNLCLHFADERTYFDVFLGLDAQPGDVFLLGDGSS